MRLSIEVVGNNLADIRARAQRVAAQFYGHDNFELDEFPAEVAETEEIRESSGRVAAVNATFTGRFTAYEKGARSA